VPASHTVSAILGVVTFLLAAVAVAVTEGWLASATVAGLTPTGLGFLAGVAFIAAAGAYLVEESNWSHGFTGLEGRRRGK